MVGGGGYHSIVKILQDVEKQQPEEYDASFQEILAHCTKSQHVPALTILCQGAIAAKAASANGATEIKQQILSSIGWPQNFPDLYNKSGNNNILKKKYWKDVFENKELTDIDGLKETVKLELIMFASKEIIDINNKVLGRLIDHVWSDISSDNIDINIICEAWTSLNEITYSV